MLGLRARRGVGSGSDTSRRAELPNPKLGRRASVGSAERDGVIMSDTELIDNGLVRDLTDAFEERGKGVAVDACEDCLLDCAGAGDGSTSRAEAS